MKARSIKKMGCLLGSILAIIMYAMVCAISWIITCGLVKLITLCFGLTFSWAIATGVWLVLFIARAVLSPTVHVKK